MEKQENLFKTLGMEEPVKKDTSNNEKVDSKKEEEFKGVRHVVVYGNELFSIDDPKVTMEEIRERIVNEFHFAEFSKERTEMSLDRKTGIVVPCIKYQKKG